MTLVLAPHLSPSAQSKCTPQVGGQDPCQPRLASRARWAPISLPIYNIEGLARQQNIYQCGKTKRRHSLVFVEASTLVASGLANAGALRTVHRRIDGCGFVFTCPISGSSSLADGSPISLKPVLPSCRKKMRSHFIWLCVGSRATESTRTTPLALVNDPSLFRIVTGRIPAPERMNARFNSGILGSGGTKGGKTKTGRSGESRSLPNASDRLRNTTPRVLHHGRSAFEFIVHFPRSSEQVGTTPNKGLEGSVFWLAPHGRAVSPRMSLSGPDVVVIGLSKLKGRDANCILSARRVPFLSPRQGGAASAPTQEGGPTRPS